ncbi:SMC-Scp complex subunit ScpB [bacterium]|nr:SMC-Scp complex subunit ScpB [bacterium]
MLNRSWNGRRRTTMAPTHRAPLVGKSDRPSAAERRVRRWRADSIRGQRNLPRDGRLRHRSVERPVSPVEGTTVGLPMLEEPRIESAGTLPHLPHNLALVEALLFVADEPLDADEIAASGNLLTAEVPDLIDKLSEWFVRTGHAFTIQRVAGGWRLTTRPEFADIIRKHLKGRSRTRLSRAALEAVSIIAYRQPITRAEVDAIRGVDTAPVLRNLLERDLIKVTGRAESPGRPLLYGTTQGFLQYFGLESIRDLPVPDELLGSEPEEVREGTAVNEPRGPFEAG